MIFAEDINQHLLEPTTRFAELLRNLASAAMSVTHHDAASDEPGYIHEVQVMERRFRNLLRSYLAGTGKKPLDGASDGV